MLDVDGARGLEYRWRYPQHFSVALYYRHRFAVFLQSTVRTAEHTHETSTTEYFFAYSLNMVISSANMKCTAIHENKIV